MTTLTIERGTLPQTHFQDVDDLARFMAQWNFERELDESITAAKLIPTEKLINI
jgi:hypothetical protein